MDLTLRAGQMRAHTARTEEAHHPGREAQSELEDMRARVWVRMRRSCVARIRTCSSRFLGMRSDLEAAIITIQLLVRKRVHEAALSQQL